jgi:hypothetical protein
MKKAVILPLVTWSVGCTNDPAYGGKRASQWRQQLRDPKADVRRAAAAGLGEVGDRARVFVLDLATALKDADEGVRVGAAVSLWGMGSAAGEIAAVLGDRSADVRQDAAGALGECEAEAAQVVTAATVLKDKIPAVRDAAVKSLAKLGPAANDAAPAFVHNFFTFTLAKPHAARSNGYSGWRGYDRYPPTAYRQPGQ